MNVYAISFIAAGNYDDCENILLMIENRPPRSHLEDMWNERMSYRNGVTAGELGAKDDFYEFRGNKWRRKGSVNLSVDQRSPTGNESDYSDEETKTSKSGKSKFLLDNEQPSELLRETAYETVRLELGEPEGTGPGAEAENDGSDANGDNSMSSREMSSEVNYIVNPAGLASLLESISFQTSDIDLLLTLYSLIDKRGLKSVDIRDVLLSFLVVCSASVSACLRSAFRLYDRARSTVMGKDAMIHVLGTLSRACSYFGDRGLSQSQVVDLVDSLFTMAGKLEGCISYEDYHDLIVKHPIVEMMLSIQFQGPVRDKILDEEKIYALDIIV
jgi:Ca2+-binding EF-hand superfamily protein